MTTAGLHAVLCRQEVVLIPTAAAVHKGLTLPGLGVVEVPDLLGPAGTRILRLQAEGRLRTCWDGRGSGSVMRAIITARSTRSTTETTSLSAIENVRVLGAGQIEKAI